MPTTPSKEGTDGPTSLQAVRRCSGARAGDHVARSCSPRRGVADSLVGFLVAAVWAMHEHEADHALAGASELPDPRNRYDARLSNVTAVQRPQHSVFRNVGRWTRSRAESW